MKNKRGVGLVVVMALSLMVVAAVPTGADILTVNVSADNIVLPQGSTAIIPIMITEAPGNNISAARMNLTYDQSVVEIVGVGGSDFDNADGLFFSNPTTTPGKVRMIGIQWGNSSDPTTENLATPVKFADVTVKAIGYPGDYTPLNLEIDDLNMGSGSEYHELRQNNGSVTIPPGVPVLNAYGMIALIGLLAIVLTIAIRRRQ